MFRNFYVLMYKNKGCEKANIRGAYIFLWILRPKSKKEDLRKNQSFVRISS